MTTRPWAHLPNAQHIDTVLADVKARPAVWSSAWYAARHESPGVAWCKPSDAAWYAAQDAVSALITWDDSADLLDKSPNELRAIENTASWPMNHQAYRLLPYIIVRAEARNSEALMEILT